MIKPRMAIDDAAFTSFYRSEHEQQVRRAYLLLGGSVAAHDVVANAFLAVYRRWDSIDDPGPYLNRCVVNGCRDARRRGWRESLRGDALTEIDRPVGDEVDEMAAVLAGLPFRQRAAIVLRFYGGFSEVEIASYLGCRPGTVGSLIHRGLRALRTELAEEDHHE